MAKKILVTGAEGFIGSHLTERLVADGFEVTALVLYNSFNNWGWLETLHPEIRSQIKVIMGDVRDENSVRQVVKGQDIVFHLAALIAIPYSYQAPASYVDTNIKGTLNVLQACRDFSVPRLIHTSTSETYGTAQYVPIDEKHPLQGQSPYSASKIGADMMAESYHRSFGLPVSIVRPFNTYGPRQSCRAVIPTIIGQIAAGQRRIKLGAVTPTRDFNYVKDTVAGFLTAARSDAAVGQVINIGSNYEVSIGDTVNLIAEVMGVEISVETEEQRLRPEKSEVERLWADNAKARMLLGWQPEYGGKEGFKRGLAETAAWFKDPLNLRHYKTDVYNV